MYAPRWENFWQACPACLRKRESPYKPMPAEGRIRNASKKLPRRNKSVSARPFVFCSVLI
jgi:hypothetical protein